MARSKSRHRFRPGGYAPYQNDPPSSWRNSPDPMRRSSHLGAAMVLFAGPSAVVHDRSCERLRG